MTITSSKLTAAAGLAAIAAGVIFIGVQIHHPHAVVASVTSAEWAIRNSLKVLMAVLALAGLTGLYVRQVTEIGIVGLLGYLVLSASYLSIVATAAIAAYVLPALAGTSAAYVGDVLAEANNHHAAGDIGLLHTVIQVQGYTYLAGGLIFGLALYRSRVVARWAAVLLAVGGAVTVVLHILPDAFYRFLAVPNGIAMIALGYSLWRVARTTAGTPLTSRVATPAGVR
jgi:hypothetical protein